MRRILAIISTLTLLIAMCQVGFTVNAATYADFSYEDVTIYSDTTNWTKTTTGANITNLAAYYAQTYTRYGAGSGNKGGNLPANDDAKFNYYNTGASNNDDCASFVSRAYAFAGVDFSASWYAWGIDEAAHAHTVSGFASAEYIYNMLIYTQNPIKGKEVTHGGNGGWWGLGSFPSDTFRTGDIVLIDFDKDYKGDHAVLVLDNSGTIASSNGDMQLSASAVANRWNGSYKLIRPLTIKRVKSGSNAIISIDSRAGQGIGASGQMAYCFDESAVNRYNISNKRHTPVTIPKLFNSQTGEVYYCIEYHKMHPVFKGYEKTSTQATNTYFKFICANGYYSHADSYSTFNDRLKVFAQAQGKSYTALQNNYEAYCATQIAIWQASGCAFAPISSDEGYLHLYSAPSQRVMNAAAILYQAAKTVPSATSTALTLKINQGTGFKVATTTINGTKYNYAGPYTVTGNVDFPIFTIVTNNTSVKTNTALNITNASNDKDYTKGTAFYIFAPVTLKNVSMRATAKANVAYIPSTGWELYQSAVSPAYQQRLISPPAQPVRPQGQVNLKLDFPEQKGSLKIVKTSEDNEIQDVQFRVQGTGGITYDKTFSTDANGVITIADLEIGNYTITEIVADKYVSQKTVTVTVNAEAVTTQNFVNKLLTVPVKIIKTDRKTTKPLKDAKFELRNKNNEVLDTLITDANGEATSKPIPVGTGYYLIEVEAPPTYIKSDEKIAVDVTKADEGKTITKTAQNDQKKGALKIVKTSEDNEIQDVQFRVQGTNGISYDKTFSTDANGVITINDLENGDYIITEIVADKYVSQKTVTTTTQPGEVVAVAFENKLLRVPVKIIKTDGTTNKPLANAKFELRNKNDEVLDTLITDANGEATSKPIPVGTGYYLIEVEAPPTYIKSDEKIAVDVTKADEGKIIAKTAQNAPKMGKIKLYKTGEMLTDYKLMDSKFGKIYEPVFDWGNLKNAVYEIYAAEKIKTADGTVKYAAGDLVDTITTGETGTATSKELFLGKYNVKEKTAPVGYALSNEVHEVNLTTTDSTAEIFLSELVAKDDKQRIQITLLKDLEENENYPNKTAYKHVIYGIFNSDDICISEDKTIPKDSILELIGIDENGEGFFTIDLPFGNYYIKEMQTAEGYKLDEKKYEFTFEPQEENITAIELNLADQYGTFVNTVVRGQLEITKISSMDGKPLKGAKYGVYTTEDKLVKELVTDSDGKASAILPYGDYYLFELEAPQKFLLDEKKYPFSIKEGGDQKEIIVRMTLKDAPRIGTIIPEYHEGGQSEGNDGHEKARTTSTGDETNYTPYILMLCLSGLVLAGFGARTIAVKRKKEYSR